MLSVILLPYHTSFSLSKDFILSSLPQSLFSEALQDDPTASEITLTNPDVTPDAIQMLVDSSHGIEPRQHNPNLILAYRYLNIPWLLYYVDPLYDQIPNREIITDPRNREVWEEAIKTDHELIVGYYLVKGWVPTNKDLIMAAKKGAAKVVRLLLGNERVNPATWNNHAIRWAAGNGHLDVVRLLLGDDRVNPADLNNYAIIGAAEEGHLEVVRLLLGDDRVNPADLNNQAIRMAASKGHLEIVRLLLVDARVNPADKNNEAVKWAAEEGHLEVVELLKADPRVQAVGGY
jgi:hypothetical protein